MVFTPNTATRLVREVESRTMTSVFLVSLHLPFIEVCDLIFAAGALLWPGVLFDPLLEVVTLAAFLALIGAGFIGFLTTIKPAHYIENHMN